MVSSLFYYSKLLGQYLRIVGPDAPSSPPVCEEPKPQVPVQTGPSYRQIKRAYHGVAQRKERHRQAEALEQLTEEQKRRQEEYEWSRNFDTDPVVMQLRERAHRDDPIACFRLFQLYLYNVIDRANDYQMAYGYLTDARRLELPAARLARNYIGRDSKMLFSPPCRYLCLQLDPYMNFQVISKLPKEVRRADAQDGLRP